MVDTTPTFAQFAEFTKAKATPIELSSLADCLRVLNQLTADMRQLVAALEQHAKGAEDHQLGAVLHRFRTIGTDFLTAVTVVELPEKCRALTDH